ncbi:unnamed protein product [Chondrus crispus]|uniref:Uncharacterized protein n=1 Tax=Chondrus crispus TaxID=2769 RepID=R7Q8A8_CHOCR|nr:unnamed protein product [Chondrus crispus]CDF34018.1 unnamed protein product [Chondrus crispus]|eukprot:XP_005713837.1 unnamed protein product [Chondrus crispus]
MAASKVLYEVTQQHWRVSRRTRPTLLPLLRTPARFIPLSHKQVLCLVLSSKLHFVPQQPVTPSKKLVTKPLAKLDVHQPVPSWSTAHTLCPRVVSALGRTSGSSTLRNISPPTLRRIKSGTQNVASTTSHKLTRDELIVFHDLRGKAHAVRAAR